MERVGDRVGGVRVCCDVLRERERFEAQRWRAGLRLAALFLLQPAPVAGEIFRDDLHLVVGVDVVIAIRVIERQHFLVRARIVQREVAVDHLQRAPHLGDDVRHGPASPVAAVFAAVRPVVDVHVALDGHVRPRRGRDIHALALEAQARHEIAIHIWIRVAHGRRVIRRRRADELRVLDALAEALRELVVPVRIRARQELVRTHVAERIHDDVLVRRRALRLRDALVHPDVAMRRRRERRSRERHAERHDARAKSPLPAFAIQPQMYCHDDQPPFILFSHRFRCPNMRRFMRFVPKICISCRFLTLADEFLL